MELIFFDRNSLQYKDYGFVDNEYDIQLDLVVTQRSSFLVNKSKLNIALGDILIIKNKDFFYVGIIESIEVQNEFKTQIHTLDFKEIFNKEILALTFEGDVASYLEQMIRSNFIESSDNNQNLSYLTIENQASVQGVLFFEEDRIIAISELIELINKSYGISMLYEVTFIRGRVLGIKIKINQTSTGIKIKSNLKNITDLVINDSEAQLVNKVIFYPKHSNTEHLQEVIYLLLTNGEISNDLNHPLRYRNVNSKAFIYSDNDYPKLDLRARNEMLSSKLDHQITFTINNNQSNPKLQLGDFVEFITESKVYDSIVTGLRYLKTMKLTQVTLGEFRIKLTDKIKLLNKTVKSSTGNVQVTQTTLTNLDGGEY